MSEYFLTTSKSYADEFALAKEIYLYPGRFYKEFEIGRLLDWVK